MSDIMIDLETLSTAPDAAIVSIGAVEMLLEGIGRTFFRVVDLESARSYGGRIDSDTIMWWMRQSDEARASWAGEDGIQRVHIAAMLRDLREWAASIGPLDDRKFWSNGADFDLPILSNAMVRLGQDTPLWHHWNARCYRTLKNLRSDVICPDRVGPHHDALYDARYQARHWIAIMRAEGGAA